MRSPAWSTGTWAQKKPPQASAAGTATVPVMPSIRPSVTRRETRRWLGRMRNLGSWRGLLLLAEPAAVAEEAGHDERVREPFTGAAFDRDGRGVGLGATGATEAAEPGRNRLG